MPLTFPVAELKISSYVQSVGYTACVLTVYRVDDGGVDGQGQQQYARTFKVRRGVVLEPGISKAQILTAATERLQTWAVEQGFNLPANRLICTL